MTQPQYIHNGVTLIFAQTHAAILPRGELAKDTETNRLNLPTFLKQSLFSNHNTTILYLRNPYT